MTPAWEEGLRHSAVFVCLVTRHTLRSPECWEQIQLARRLGKPCRVVVKKGTPIPRGFFDGFDDIRYYPFRTNADLARIVRALSAARASPDAAVRGDAAPDADGVTPGTRALARGRIREGEGGSKWQTPDPQPAPTSSSRTSSPTAPQRA